MEIAKMLVLSTAHVKESTARYLDQEPDALIVYPKGKYGWIIPILDVEDMERHAMLPDDLKKVIAFGREQECDWIMFDSDANTVEGLSLYDW